MPKLLQKLQKDRDKIYAIAEKYGVSNIRVFGSVARGEENEDSDIDFLVKVNNYDKYCKGKFFKNLFQEELSKTFKRKIDVITEKSLHPILKKEITSTAKAL